MQSLSKANGKPSTFNTSLIFRLDISLYATQFFYRTKIKNKNKFINHAARLFL